MITRQSTLLLSEILVGVEETDGQRAGWFPMHKKHILHLRRGNGLGHCCVFSREYFEEVSHLAKARREWLLRRIVAAATYATTDRRSAVRSSVRTEERKRERGEKRRDFGGWTVI